MTKVGARETWMVNRMKRHHATNRKRVYVGFLDYRPHVQLELGARVVACYVSKAAAKRAYADVRTADLIFDARTRDDVTHVGSKPMTKVGR